MHKNQNSTALQDTKNHVHTMQKPQTIHKSGNRNDKYHLIFPGSTYGFFIITSATLVHNSQLSKLIE